MYSLSALVYSSIQSTCVSYSLLHLPSAKSYWVEVGIYSHIRQSTCANNCYIAIGETTHAALYEVREIFLATVRSCLFIASTLWMRPITYKHIFYGHHLSSNV